MSHQEINRTSRFPLSLGILHPGEMGVSVAASAMNSGCEVFWASEGRSEATRQRAGKHGLKDAGSISRLVTHCPVVISICPPSAAETTAREVLGCGFRGIYVDANAISPQRAVLIGEMVSSAGARFVDGGIVGEPAWKPGTTWLHLSGEDASVVASCFSAGPLQTTDLGTQIGRASALKMCFAAYTKGTTALLAAILGTAERLGVRDELERQWDDRTPGFSGQTEKRILKGIGKAWRFEAEMREISETFAAAGMPGDFHAAAEEVYRRLASFRENPGAATLSDVLAALQKGGV